MFKDSDENVDSLPGGTVDDLDEEEEPPMDDAGIDALLEMNGVGGSGVPSAVTAPASPEPSGSRSGPKDAVTPQKRQQEAAMLMMQGKRHLLVKDVYSAVNAYQEACRIMDEVYGQMASQCGDAYLQYGQALLELARTENGVLGMSAAGVEDDDEEDEDEEEEGEDEEEGENENKEGEDEEKEEVEDLEATAKEEESVGVDVKDKGKRPAPKKRKTETEAGETANGSQDHEDEEENEVDDDVSNLQLAWEMVELAKLVFLKDSSSKERQMKAADCFMTLGEISLETEAYDAAIDDFNRCLEIQRRHLPEDDRYIAETYYQLGLTYSFDKNYSEARLNFRHALKVLETRVGNCEEIVRVAKATAGGSREKAMADEAVRKADEEAKDLKGLLPEIRAKFEDARDMEAEHSEASQAVKEASENLHRSPSKSVGAGSSGSSAASAAPSTTTMEAPSTSDSSSSKTATEKSVNSFFTLPFPREEDGQKITFGSSSSNEVKRIPVRRNLNKESSSSSSFAAPSLSTSGVNNISSLVRRKRKTEDGVSSQETACTSGEGGDVKNGEVKNGAVDANSAAPTVSNGNAESTPEPKRIKVDE